jgi:predicted nucleic acid-binding protein
MRFWDASALVALLIEEGLTDELLELYPGDEVVAWWATEVECAYAVARLERSGALAPGRTTEAFDRLRSLASAWHRIEPGDLVKETALRLLRAHDLRAAEGLQLAAAVIAAEREGFPRL